MGNSIIILVIGTISIVSIVILNNASKLNESIDDIGSHYEKMQSKNISNSMANMILSTIADCTSYRVNTPQTKNLFNGTTSYTVKTVYLASIADSAIEINLNGIYMDDTCAFLVYVRIPTSAGFIPGAVKAAISTNNDISTLGNLNVDGRNHDMNGNLISNSGTYGIWTTQNASQGGSSDVGGTNDSNVDYAPSHPGDASIIKTNQTYTGGYPDSPDKVMGGASEGFPEGTLKNLAMSGVNGSQYVTDPSNLTYPLSGITYVEMDTKTQGNKNTWNNANIQGEGILIVHNTATNATIKTCTNTFKGLVIADDIDKVHGTIIGALVGITSSPASGNCIGNGNGDVLYSSEAIKKGVGSTGNSAGGTPSNYGYGKHRLEILHWYE